MKITVFTGAGVSRESGLLTFRDSDGLWCGHRIEDVAVPSAWARDPVTVLDFYNQRRRDVMAAEPNAAHQALAELETKHDVTIVTQNIDDLHERAGSTKVLHLHGEIMKARSEQNDHVIIPCSTDTLLGDLAPDGAQLRPHVVWFEEGVLEMETAIDAATYADVFVIIGTSLNVFPAAGLVDMTRAPRRVLIDPHPPELYGRRSTIEVIAKPATEGVQELVAQLMA